MTIPGKTIDFVIIGAAKAGTTSLASWLGSHPDVCMSNPKETMFFGSPRLFDQGLEYFHSSFFSHYQGESLIGDATPAYSNRDRHPGTHERVFSVNPDARIIYIVRDPLRKVESSWQMHVNLDPGLVKTPEHEIRCRKAREGFMEYINTPEIFSVLVNVCRYGYQLDPWKSRFQGNCIHVMFLEDLVSGRDKEMSNLCLFLGLNPQPLLGVPLKANNTLNERRAQRSFVRYLSKLGLHKHLPSRFKTLLAKSPLTSVPHSSLLKPVWPSKTLERFVHEVEDDVKGFLKAHGKQEDFYSFHRAEV
jgi:hypothetical protein